MRYDPPLRDMRFVIEEVLDAPGVWARQPAFSSLDAETAGEVLAQAGRFAAEVLAPLNGPGDVAGCVWQGGQVCTPPGFARAYRAFVEGGWPALAADPACGGQGLPQLLNAALYEMLAAANHGWTMYPGLLHGAYECLHAHASAELRERYLPKITSGEWLSTMCLTEAHAGSDLGLLRTRAVPRADGACEVTGQKIFISGGEHDLTDNIVHLVLARLPDAPAGTKGLSLLLVPKVLPDGTRNAVHCDAIEKKMGLKGSATCTMRFEAATGWLLGEPNRGLAAMFLMMNAARLHVGLQGLGHMEVSTQNALRHAHERLQSRAPRRPPRAAPGSETGTAADPIAWHPAVRRALWTLQARTEGARVLAYWAAQALDDAAAEADDSARQQADARAGLLTPVVKALLTTLGHQGADQALGIWGGHGYIQEVGIEQVVRDSRITMVYEGSNEIQAIDLLLRKVLPDGGVAFGRLLDWAGAQVEGASNAQRLRQGLQALHECADGLVAGAADDPEWPYRAADDFLHAVGEALLACAWARSEAVARTALAAGPADPAFYQTKLQRARFQIDYLAGELPRHLAAVERSRAALPFLPVP
jgi:alkylation response protein AidB-like acyl-CoA dehydrogenase